MKHFLMCVSTLVHTNLHIRILLLDKHMYKTKTIKIRTACIRTFEKNFNL